MAPVALAITIYLAAKHRVRATAAHLYKLANAITAGIRGVLVVTLTTVGSAAAIPISIVTSAIAINIRQLPRLLQVAGKLALVGSPLMVFTFLIVCAIANPFVSEALDYSHDRSSATEVFDADGRWIGILPPASFADWSDGSVLPPDHAAVSPISIPPVWRECIAYLEDRSAFDGMSSYLGFNPIALAGAGVDTVLFHKRRGASTLLMQVVRTLNGQSPSAHERIGAVALRKIAELVGSATLAKMLRKRDPHLFERYIGMHLPLVIGAAGSRFGDEIHGIELAARILFGRSAGDLPPEKQAILAAAVKRPIVLAPPGDDKGRQLALARWAQVKARADHCLAGAFAADAAAIAVSRQRLHDISLPEPPLDPKLAALLPAERQQAWRIIVNPVRRTLYFTGSDLKLAKTELDGAFPLGWRGKLVAIHLTTSATDSRQFDNAVMAELRELQKATVGLALDLINVAADDAAQVVIALADDRGRLRRLYSSHNGLFFTKKAEMGSTAKMIAAVVLSHRTNPNTAYCRAPIPGMAVGEIEDKAACRSHSNWLSAREAFARSNSPAVNWALRHYSNRAEMEKVAAAFGLPTFGDVPVATALSLGIVELTPAEMLRVAEAIGRVLVGDHSDVPFPTVISAAAVLGSDGLTRSGPISIDEPLHAERLWSAVPARARPFLANVLAATSEPGGTLHRLALLKTALGGKLYAKTGTVSVRGDTQTLQIAGVFMHAGRPWSFTVMISSPDSHRPLGRNLAAGQFASLVGLVSRRLLPITPDGGARYATR